MAGWCQDWLHNKTIQDEINGCSRQPNLQLQTIGKHCPSWPTGREVMTTSSCRVRVKFFKKYLSERMSDPGKIIRPGR